MLFRSEDAARDGGGGDVAVTRRPKGEGRGVVCKWCDVVGPLEKDVLMDDALEKVGWNRKAQRRPELCTGAAACHL